jgi:hypothetical protein
MTGVYSLFPITNNTVPCPYSYYETYQDRHLASNVDYRPSGSYSQYEIWDSTNEALGFNYNIRLDPTSTYDQVTQDCYRNMIKVDIFFRDNLLKWPVKNNGRIIKVCLNHPKYYNNACWDPNTERVCFGKVNTKYFKPLASSLDILAHELGHAVVFYSSKLNYLHQSGALNESIADVFAMMVKHCQTRSYANDPNTNWKYGNGLLLNAEGGNSFRSFSNPETAYRFHPILGHNLQVGHMNNYRNLQYDNDSGGVHANSGIPNKAFYLASNDVGGYCWEKVGNIWHTALINSKSTDNFEDFACRTMCATKNLRYGPHVQQSIGNAWLNVGVDLRRHGCKLYESSLTVDFLKRSIECFSNHDYANGMRYFYATCSREPVTSSAVYKNTWEIKGKPLGCLEYGRYSFHNEHGYTSSDEQRTVALNKFKQAIDDYETLQFNPPSDIIPLGRSDTFCDTIRRFFC